MSDQNIQKPVYVKNPYRTVKPKIEEVVPEHVRLEIKPVEWQNFNDDFKSSSATKKFLPKRNPIAAPIKANDSPPKEIAPPIVGHIEQAVTQDLVLEEQTFKDDIPDSEVPSPPVRHRRFVVVDNAEVPEEFPSQPTPRHTVAASNNVQAPLIQEPNMGELFYIPENGYAIFMGNDFICACANKDEAEQAVEIILSTNPPEELVVVKRVNIKIGVSLGE